MAIGRRQLFSIATTTCVVSHEASHLSKSSIAADVAFASGISGSQILRVEGGESVGVSLSPMLQNKEVSTEEEN
ncbi:unnamed protein product [Arabis nemorensis]|uniref:Uncharacterized protein n=1 Tax=Arabis nemorensis TaxID=586526 RepID=A0A565ATN4_9BRAS|nr:unnamed protein product [Arabis nemorensis]